MGQINVFFSITHSEHNTLLSGLSSDRQSLAFFADPFQDLTESDLTKPDLSKVDNKKHILTRRD